MSCFPTSLLRLRCSKGRCKNKSKNYFLPGYISVTCMLCPRRPRSLKFWTPFSNDEASRPLFPGRAERLCSLSVTSPRPPALPLTGSHPSSRTCLNLESCSWIMDPATVSKMSLYCANFRQRVPSSSTDAVCRDLFVSMQEIILKSQSTRFHLSSQRSFRR